MVSPARETMQVIFEGRRGWEVARRSGTGLRVKWFFKLKAFCVPPFLDCGTAGLPGLADSTWCFRDSWYSMPGTCRMCRYRDGGFAVDHGYGDSVDGIISMSPWKAGFWKASI